MHILKHGDRIRFDHEGTRWHVVTARGSAMDHGADPDAAFRGARHAGQSCYMLVPDSIAHVESGVGAGALRPGSDHVVRVKDPALIEGEIQRIVEGPRQGQFGFAACRRPERALRPTRQDEIFDYWIYNEDLVVARDRHTHLWQGSWVPADRERKPQRLTNEGIRAVRGRVRLCAPDGRKVV